MRSRSRIRQFLRERAGNVAIISTLMLPVLAGLAGLGIETTMWYQRQLELQSVADIAAYGAAIVRGGGGTESDAVTSATADAVTNGWRRADGTIAIHSPPTISTYRNPRSVEVILTENQTPLFARIYRGDSPITITVRSIAVWREQYRSWPDDRARRRQPYYWRGTADQRPVR